MSVGSSCRVSAVCSAAAPLEASIRPFRRPWRTLSWSVFFFQAEDGIRYLIVTGVKTCALPISPIRVVCKGPVPLAGTGRSQTTRIGAAMRCKPAEMLVAFLIVAAPCQGAGDTDVQKHLRSEERRVGKECRSRWSPYH